MATLKNTTITQTGSNVGRGVVLPSGTDAQRTNDANKNKLRYNSDRGYVEFLHQGAWTDIRNGWGGPVSDGLIANYDATDAASAPTGTNGTTWVNLSNHPNRLPNLSINAIDSNISYSTTTGVGSVLNSTTGTGGSVGIPVNLTNFSKASGSWEFWVRPTSWSSSNGFFVNRADDTANDSQWHWVGIWSSGSTNYFRIGSNQSCCNMDTTTTNMPTLNAWNQVVYTWDIRGSAAGQSSGYASIWYNGVRQAERTISETTPLTNVSSEGRFFVGHNSTNSKFLGHMGIIRHYNRPLTDIEIRHNYKAGAEKFY